MQHEIDNLPNLRLNNSNDKAFVNVVFEQASRLLKNQLLRHYTDHSISHSIRVLSYISRLLQGCKTKLSDDEKVILICASLLHDIGMQTTKYLDDFNPELAPDFSTLEEIRENHHEYSARMIIESVTLSPEERYYLGLESRRELVDFIAIVAKHHRKCDISLLNEPVIGEKPVRLQLLSALLRLGDCLDLDYRRVDVGILVTTNIPIKSQLYWYFHHYVQGLSIDNRKITVSFRFPEIYYNNTNYQQVVIDYVNKELGSQMDEIYDILDAYGIRLYKNVDYYLNYSSTLEILNNNIETYIKVLSKDNIVYSEDVFDVFPTRDICINNIIFNRLANERVETLVFFGGIATRLCQENDINEIIKWLENQENSNLYICYEDETTAKLRASELDPSSIPTGLLPTEPYLRYEMKLVNIEKSKGLYPISLENRVHFLPLSMSLNTYPIMVDDDLYCNILTEVRSSESTTARMRNNGVGIKTKIELLSYMLYVLANSGDNNETQALISHIHGAHIRLCGYQATISGKR